MKTKTSLLALLLACATASAWAQVSGSGTAADPYLVATADDLYDVRNHPDACYKQTADIDLGAWIAEENPTQGWIPIPTFSGTYDGDGHVIDGLFIDRPSEDNIGLFGDVSAATIKNVVLTNASVTGGVAVGALAGMAEDRRTHLYNCRLTEIDVKCSNEGGGLIGRICGYVDHCVAVGSHVSGYGAIGGLIGRAEVEASTEIHHNDVIECDVHLFINNNNHASGGLIGHVRHRTSTGGNIYHNYVSGTVEGPKAGGIFGMQYLGTSNNVYVNIYCNRFDGTICARDIAYGICPIGGNGYGSYQNIKPYRNIVTGVIKAIGGNKIVYGITSYTNGHDNVCSADTLSGGDTVYRSGGSGDHAYTGTVVVKNGEVVSVSDGGRDGTALSSRMLRRMSTYLAWGFTTDDWAIVEGVTLPYNIDQSTPPTIEQCVCSDEGRDNAYVTGVASGSGRVYVFAGGRMTEAQVNDGIWVAEIGSVAEGTQVKVSVEAEGKRPSVVVSAVAVSPTEVAVGSAAVSARPVCTTAYNLQGQRVQGSAMRKGLYIMEGRKLMAR